MTTRIRHILVAVGETGSTSTGEMRKIAVLARTSGASVELFHAITDPDPALSFPETVTAETVRKRRVAFVRKHERRLERLARNAALRKVPVTCTAIWDHPPHEAVIRRARKIRADLVVAATREHRFGARLLLRNTDWELIRHCPVPVLLLKSHRAWHRPGVIAAVDPFHEHARPADLDTRLLRRRRTKAFSPLTALQVSMRLRRQSSCIVWLPRCYARGTKWTPRYRPVATGLFGS